MGKKQRSGSEIEELRGKVREKDKLIKQLTKRLGASRKQAGRLEQLLPEPDPEPVYEAPVITEAQSCPQCGKNATHTDLGVRVLISCLKCGYRKSKKK